MEEPSAGRARGRGEAGLLVSADDYGYAPSYDAGILEAARAGALDGVGVMVMRAPDPAPLLATGVRPGLHLEPLGEAPLARQLAEFERLFESPPARLDGHKHCHAEPGGPALEVARAAKRLGIAVRSVSPRHRRLLRCLGVATEELLVGRMAENEPRLPAPVEAWLAGVPLRGPTEWMVHPGHPGGGSVYDRGRAEDLELLLELAPALRAARAG